LGFALGTGTASDARRVFDVIVAHLCSKRMELALAIQHGRGVEGWLQHESVVALHNAHSAGSTGRINRFYREGLRDPRSTTHDPGSRRRPFDLVFDNPDMAASLKLYLPWKGTNEGVADVQRDLVELREHPHHGFLIAGRLDFHDGMTRGGGQRRVTTGGDWLVDVVRQAQHRMRLKPLVNPADSGSGEVRLIDLPPVWNDQTGSYREPFLAVGGWSVWK